MATIVRPPPPRRLPPSLPALEQSGHISRASERSCRSSASSSIPDLPRLLARKPPPIPLHRSGSLSSTSSKAILNPPPLKLSSKPTAIHDLPSSSTAPTPSTPSCLQCRDFSQADAHASLFPRAAVRSLEELAYGLAEPFEDDIDKARAIFTWLHYNISYDAESFFSGNLQSSTPTSTLASGLAVCEGYAGLFERLGTLMGLQVHTVSGHGKGYGYQALCDDEPMPEMTSNHAWNCVVFHNEWHLVDSCWGSGFLNGKTYTARLAPKWFIAPPVEFGQRHFPSDPAFQLTSKQYTWKEYILASESPNLTGEFDQFGLHPMCLQPSKRLVPSGQYVKFSVTKRCEHMSVAEADNYVFVIGTTTQDYIPLEYSTRENAWMANIFVSGEGNITLYTVDKVAGHDAMGLGVIGFKHAKGRKAMSFKGLAVWKVEES
ncbi:hypothetical protein CVT26_011621 [Gymnopilus dilepis]|uniref:Transglutaminase-like domain-containing protein n=1 Tax=Gymnopilus dilepis TaxID=231916 RepID=A0A409VXX9_9AGAR|nr:hypothetical protein CVT26_011621 [Gymnopilus dilepis]